MSHESALTSLVCGAAGVGGWQLAHNYLVNVRWSEIATGTAVGTPSCRRKELPTLHSCHLLLNLQQTAVLLRAGVTCSDTVQNHTLCVLKAVF